MRQTTIILLLFLFADPVWSQERIDPRHPDALAFPELGRMIGTIGRTTSQQGIGEQFGFRICPVGDVNRDGLADWLVGHHRVDSIQIFDGIPLPPIEFLLYKGVRGGLPAVQSGVRVGPTELFCQTDFLGAGDFDADGNLDIVMVAGAYGDTSFGNDGTKDLRYISVYWGNDSGVYTNSDTSRLMSSAYTWLGTMFGTAGDLTGDGADDFVLYVELGEAQGWGQTVQAPRMYVFTGGHAQRWGRKGVSGHARLQWWNSQNHFTTPEVQIVDHDRDGVSDIALLEQAVNSMGTGTNSRISILYGRSGNEIPDTVDLEQVTLSIANGKTTRLRDMTGDGAPELVMTCGTEKTFKVFAGRPRQRLLAQYGTGSEGPTAGQGWWSRPWQVVLQPRAIHDGWSLIDQMSLPDLGDGNMDGHDDIWTYSAPFLLCYTTGKYLDHWADGYFYVGGLYEGENIGDIDGSGKRTLALYYDHFSSDPRYPFPGGIVFIQQNAALPTAYLDSPLRLPHDESRIESKGTAGSDIDLVLDGSHEEVSVRLRGGVPGIWYTVTITNQIGESIASHRLSVTDSRADLHLPLGIYFISILTEKGFLTRPLVIHGGP